MILKYQKLEHKLKHAFGISRYTYQSQPAVIVSLAMHGHAGYGEATFNPYYNVDQENIIFAFEQARSIIEHTDSFHPDALWEKLSRVIGDHPFALCALNNASWDLYGKLQGQSVRGVLNLKEGNTPLTSYTIGLASESEMIMKMKEKPWPLYKIKLGNDGDIEIMHAIRSQFEADLRIDANGAWSFENTLRYCEILKSLDVEFVEQPLKAFDREGMEELAGKAALPLIADEDCRLEEDVEKCHGLFDGFNIKLQKCGGLTPALRMIRHGRELGLKIMIGCMTESSIGIAAAVQLLTLVDYADLDGPLLIADDKSSGISYNYGKILLSGGTGLGVKPDKQTVDL